MKRKLSFQGKLFFLILLFFHCSTYDKQTDLSHVYAKLLKSSLTGGQACQFMCELTSEVFVLLPILSGLAQVRNIASRAPEWTLLRCTTHHTGEKGEVKWLTGWPGRSGSKPCTVERPIPSRQTCVVFASTMCHDFEQGTLPSEFCFHLLNWNCITYLSVLWGLSNVTFVNHLAVQLPFLLISIPDLSFPRAVINSSEENRPGGDR